MKLINIIKKSINTPEGKESSTRIATYVILLLITLFTVVFLCLEIFNGEPPSNESIIIFTMLMGHHLTLLGINKFHENKKIKK